MKFSVGPIGRLLAGGLACAAGACAQPLETPPIPPPDGGLDASLGGSDATAPSCEAGSSTPCTCGATDDGTRGTGVRRCTGESFTACLCDDAAVIAVSDCKAGSYAGDISGTYTSDLTVLGLPADVHGSDGGMPAIVFTLAPPSANDGIFSVLDGTLRAQANNAFALEGTFSGALNCGNKTFSGTLKGSYAALGQRREFAGPLTANYDSARTAFVQGTWDLGEINGSSGAGNNAGGKGGWQASVAADSGPAQAGP